MTTLLRFLLGRRDAILALAGARGSFGLAIALVLTAALARRYDQTDFLTDPLALVLPLLVSGVNATILVIWWRLIPDRGAPRSGFVTEWKTIVTLFWMTAPLAWLYGIPWERMLDPLGAVQANVAALLIVAVWRVVLTARFLSVLYAIGFWLSFFYVMFFADLVAVVITFLAPRPIISIMGGIAHSPADAFIADVNVQIQLFGILSLPFWLITAIGVAVKSRPRQQQIPSGSSVRSAWCVVVAAFLAFSIPMIWTQPEQRLAGKINQLLVDERVYEAIDLAASHEPGDLPPHFDPRPRQWVGQRAPELWAVIAAFDDRPSAPQWVQRMWLDKAWLRLSRGHWFFQPPGDELAERVARVLAADADHRQQLRDWMERIGKSSSDEDRAFHAALTKALRKYEPEGERVEIE